MCVFCWHHLHHWRNSRRGTHVLTCQLEVPRVICLGCGKKVLAFFWCSFLFDFHDQTLQWFKLPSFCAQTSLPIILGLIQRYLHTKDLLFHSEILHLENINSKNLGYFKVLCKAKNYKWVETVTTFTWTSCLLAHFSFQVQLTQLMYHETLGSMSILSAIILWLYEGL